MIHQTLIYQKGGTIHGLAIVIGLVLIGASLYFYNQSIPLKDVDPGTAVINIVDDQASKDSEDISATSTATSTPLSSSDSATTSASVTPASTLNSSTSTLNSSTSTSTSTQVSDTKTITLKLDEQYKSGDNSFSAWAVMEDSRCAKDVQCIQAGRVIVAIRSSEGKAENIFELLPGQSKKLSRITLTLDAVNPYPISTHKTQDAEYRFVFTVTKN